MESSIQNHQKINVLLIGATGAGKSATANSLCNE